MAVRRGLLALLVLLLLGSLFVIRTVAEEPAAEDDDTELFEEDEKPEAAETAKTEDVIPDDELDLGEDEVETSEDADVVVYFPEQPDEHFPLGSDVLALIGFTNKGDKTFNITYVDAHFTSPYDQSYTIQNFSRREVGVIVEPKQQVTIEYHFKPHALDAVEYWLSGVIEFNDTESTTYRHTFVNRTIELVEKPSEINLKGLFTFFLGFAATAWVAIFAWTRFQEPKTKQSEVSDGTGGWGASVYTPARESKPVKSSKKAAKPKGSTSPRSGPAESPM